MKRKIYVASSWRNPYQPGVVAMLRLDGHEVYDFRNPPNGSGGFAWSGIDPNWENWTTEQYTEALKHPLAERGFNSDFDGMKWADTCVMVLPCGRSANTEAGWMKGFGKEVIVFSPVKQEPELMYKIYDEVIDDINILIERLSHPGKEKEGVNNELIELLQPFFNLPYAVKSKVVASQINELIEQCGNNAVPAKNILYTILPTPLPQQEGREDGWISVEDRLPEIEGEAVLCYDKYHNQIRVLCWSKYHHCWDDESGDDYYTDAVGGKVTHWMPLPKPPQP